MLINKENYIDYFLLYADNELSDSEKRAVELFASAHPSLKQELEALLSTVLKPSDETYQPLTELFKHGEQPIENSMLLLLDDELDAETSLSVEKFIRENAAVEAEWQLLRQTKLAPEVVVCPDKSSLMKQTGGKVIPVYFRRVAAAVLLGLGFFFGYNLLQSNENIGNNTQQNTAQKPETGVSVNSTFTADNSSTPKIPGAEKPEVIQTKEEHPSLMEQRVSVPQYASTTEANQKVPSAIMHHRNTESDNRFQKNEQISNIPEPSYVIHKNLNENPEEKVAHPKEEVAQNEINDLPNNAVRHNPYAFTASLEQSEVYQESESDFTPERTPEKKRGFFQKVKKMVNKKKSDLEKEDAVMIGAFEIAIK
jgi:hypothetical protein